MTTPDVRTYGPSPNAKARLDEIFNELIPSLRQRGVIPSEPYKPVLPPVIPGLPYGFRPEAGIGLDAFEGPHLRRDPVTITPPEPVDWMGSLGTIGKGLASFGSRLGPQVPFVSDKFRDYLRGGSVDELQAQMLPLPEDAGLMNRILQSRPMTGAKADIEGGMEVAERFFRPIETISRPYYPKAFEAFAPDIISQLTGLDRGTSAGISGLMPRRIQEGAYDAEADFIRQQLRDRGYGPLESAQAAYNQADIDPISDISWAAIADPSIAAPGFGLVPKISKLGRFGMSQAPPAGLLPTGPSPRATSYARVLDDGTVIDRYGQVVPETRPTPAYTPEGRPVFGRPEVPARYNTQTGEIIESFADEFAPPRPPEVPQPAAQARQLELGETAGIPAREGEQLSFPMRTSVLDEVPIDETLGPRYPYQAATRAADEILSARQELDTLINDIVVTSPVKRDTDKFKAQSLVRDKYVKDVLDETRPAVAGDPTKPRLSSRDYKTAVRYTAKHTGKTEQEIDDLFQRALAEGLADRSELARGVDLTRRLPPEIQEAVSRQIDNIFEPGEVAGFVPPDVQAAPLGAAFTRTGKAIFENRIPDSVIDPSRVMDEVQGAVDNLIVLRQQGKHQSVGYKSYYGKLRNILADKLDMTPEQIDQYIDEVSQGTLPGFEPEELATLAERNAFQPDLFDAQKPLSKAEYEAFHEIKYPKAEEMTREQYVQFLKETESIPVVQATDAVTSPSNRSAVLRTVRDPNDLPQYKAAIARLAKAVQQRYAPWISHHYLKFRSASDDDGIRWRTLIDAIESIHPGTWNFGSDVDIVTLKELMGNVSGALKRYDSFMKIEILPKLGTKTVRNGVNVTQEETKPLMQWHISRFIQAMHWENIVRKPDGTPNLSAREDSLPIPVDPRKWDADPDKPIAQKLKESAVSSVLNEDGTYKEMSEWIEDMKNTLTDDQFVDVERAARSIADFYSLERARLVESGHFTQEFADELARDYPWYNPTVYAEYLQAGKSGSGIENSIFANANDVLQGFKEDAAQLGALDPLDPEVMARKMIETDNKINQNMVAKAAHHYFTATDQEGVALDWIVEVTEQFQKTLPDGTKVNRPVPRNIDAKEGYLTFWENGQRRVFGSKGTPSNRLDEDLFDLLYGLSGLTTRAPWEIMMWFRMGAGLMRGLKTTFSPMFMVANPMLDMLNVWVRYGVGPKSIIKRMAEQMFTENGIVRQGEDNLYRAYQILGADKARTGSISKYAKELEEKMKIDGVAGEVVWIDGPVTKGKWRKAVQGWTDENFFTGGVKRVSKALEQSPRLEVFERTIRSELGSGEWMRLSKLSEKDFMHEMVYNYRGTPGRGLAEHPAMRKAGSMALDSTLNFWRGGNFVRKINPYTYFLNAGVQSMLLPFRSLGIDIMPSMKVVANPAVGEPKVVMGEWGGVISKSPTGKRFKDINVGREYPDLQELKPDNLVPWMDTISSKLSPHVQGNYRKAALRLGGMIMTQASLTAWNLAHAEAWGYWNIPWYYKYSGFLLLLKPNIDPATGEFERDEEGRIIPRFRLFPHRTREWSLAAAPQYIFEKFYEMMQEEDQVFDPATGEAMVEKDPETGKPIMVEDPETGEMVPKRKTQKPELTRARNFLEIFIGNQSPISDNPVNNLPQFGFSRVPGVSEIYDEIQNRDSWRDQPIIPAYLREKPLPEQYLSSTSYVSMGLAKIFDELSEGSVYSSPARMDHLLKNTLGGASVGLDMADWIVEGAMELHSAISKSTPDTPELQVEHYRNLKTSEEKKEFETLIMRDGIEGYKEFRKELRKPHVELSSLPWATKVIERHAPPDKSAGLEILSKQIRDEEFGKSVSEAQNEVQARLRDIKEKNYGEQQAEDAELVAWSARSAGETTVGIDPYTWRNNRSKRNDNYGYLKEHIAGIYGDDVLSMSQEDQDRFYSTIFQVGSDASQKSTGLLNEWLMANLYLIRFPEDGTPEQEREFYAARQNYISSVAAFYGEDSKTFRDFENTRMQNMTTQEENYAKAREKMAPYWNIGTNVEEFTQGLPEQYKQLWAQYINGNEETRAALSATPLIDSLKNKQRFQRREHIQKLAETDIVMREAGNLDANSAWDLDYVLTLWWGKSYEPFFSDNRILRNRLYGVHPSVTVPRLQQPVLP